MPVNTVEARVLIGWKERDEAIKYLREECVFDAPLTELDAERIWLPYRREVESLAPARNCGSPMRLPLDATERRHADAFLKFFRGLPTGAPNIRDVIKIDPSKLVAHQLYVVTDRSDGYSASAIDPADWAKIALPPKLPAPRNLGVNGCPNGIEYHIPHMEFGVTFSQQMVIQTPAPPAPAICVAVQEAPSYVSVSDFNGRTLLWAGYHRSFARMVRTADDAIARSHPTVVLTTDADLFVSPASPNQGLRDMITGPTPPLFGDFLDGRFFIKLKLRKRNYRLRVTSQLVPIDA